MVVATVTGARGMPVEARGARRARRPARFPGFDLGPPRAGAASGALARLARGAHRASAAGRHGVGFWPGAAPLATRAPTPTPPPIGTPAPPKLLRRRPA